jgi:dihydroflavonol-4-reductase
LVTGAAGHVGGNLVRALLAQKRLVRVLIHEDVRAVEGLEVEQVRGDVRDLDSLRAAFEDVSTVFHLAAQISITGDQGGRVWAINAEGAANVATACLERGVRKLIHFSSIHALRQTPLDLPLDETRPLVEGSEGIAYDRAKAAGERSVLEAATRGLDATIVNPTSILGPLDFKPSRMGEVVLLLRTRRFPALVDAGYDWVDVRDVVHGALAAEQYGRKGERYILSGHWHPFGELAGFVEEVSGAKAPSYTSPFWLARVGAPFVTAWSRITRTQPLYTSEALKVLANSNRRISCEKAVRELGYSARPLIDTLRDICRWLEETGQVS